MPRSVENAIGIPFFSSLSKATGLSLSIMLSGCSIAMALHGHPEPNFDNIQAGVTSEEVEREFGKPASTKQLENGKHEDTFTYEMANSSNPGRATMYGYIDLATIGLAEPILTVIELLQGHDETTTAVFDRENRLVEISGYRPPPPSQALVSAQESQSRYTRPALRNGASNRIPPEESMVSLEGKVKELAHRLAGHLQDQKVTRIAVLPVRDALGNENQPLGSYLTEKLTAKLHEESVARIVERSQLSRVTQELYLTHTGGFGEESAMKIGNLLGVEAVVTTLYADVGQASLDVTSKIVHVETGEILGVGTIVFPRSSVERLLSK